MREVVRRELEPAADTIEVDPLGNLIARRAGGGGPRLMLSAHMDEIGFMVTHVEEAGYLRLIPLGRLRPQDAHGPARDRPRARGPARACSAPRPST